MRMKKYWIIVTTLCIPTVCVFTILSHYANVGIYWKEVNHSIRHAPRFKMATDIGNLSISGTALTQSTELNVTTWTRKEPEPGMNESPCYKVVYTWLDERDKFHVDLIFKQTGRYECPGLSCGVQIEHGRDLDKLAASDVVFLFYKSDWNWEELIKHRTDKQKWVFWTSESPRHTNHRVIPPPKYANTTYDYLMTYRTGASNEDARLSGGGYGQFDRTKPSVPANDNTNWAAGKTKMVAWVATNCYPSTLSYDRTGFVNALSRHITIDKYGPCGSRPCKDLATCGLQQYKFYLALENSECRDYITEKFWQNSLSLGLVPIVFGAPKEDYLKIAPPNSFIFVPDFPSVTKLAEYLKQLDGNDDLYNQYFAWKKMGSILYSYVQFVNLKPQPLCDHVISRVLRDEEVEGTQKTRIERKPLVNDWESWWVNSCHSTCTKFPIPE